MKKVLALVALISLSSMAMGQYKNSSGIRLGNTSGLTYKRFITDQQALEFIASGRNEGFQLTTLFEFHKPLNIGFSEDFHLYYGVGAHVGYERLEDRLLNGSFTPPSLEFQNRERSFFTMGVNTIIGIEYRWLKVPMTVGIDIKPYLDFVGMRRTTLKFWDTAISFKYIF